MTHHNEHDNLRVNALTGQVRPLLPAKIGSLADLLELRMQWADVEAMPVIVRDRTDGVNHSWLGLDIRTLLSGEQSAGRFSVHSVILAPGAGLAPHFHDDVETYVLVDDGELELRVGNLIEIGRRFSLAFAPAKTRVSFRNRSEAPVTITLIYSAAGLERAFAAASSHWADTGETDEGRYLDILGRYGFNFDDRPLENDGKTNVKIAPVDQQILQKGDLAILRDQFASRPALPRLVHTPSEEINRNGIDPGFRKHLVTGDETGGSAMINFISRIPPAPSHFQPTEEELFFILDGALRMTCGTETAVLTRGAVAFAPRNCTHAFGPPSPDVTAKFVTLNSPAGHERAMAAIRERQRHGMTDAEFLELASHGGFVIQDR